MNCAVANIIRFRQCRNPLRILDLLFLPKGSREARVAEVCHLLRHIRAKRDEGVASPGTRSQNKRPDRVSGSTTFSLGLRPNCRERSDMATLLLLAPLFLAFEVWQLVMSERYLGIKQIARNGDPRALGLAEFTAFCWSMMLVLYVSWMVALLLLPFSRVHGLALLAVLGAGFTLRRNTSLKWVLVILTFEGAVRVGLLISLIAMAWRRL